MIVYRHIFVCGAYPPRIVSGYSHWNTIGIFESMFHVASKVNTYIQQSLEHFFYTFTCYSLDISPYVMPNKIKIDHICHVL